MTPQSQLVLFAVVSAAAACVGFANDYWIGVGITLAMAIALAQSWSLLSGLSGYVSLGHVVFYGLGSYVVVVTWMVLPIWISLPLAAVAAALFAFLMGLPVLRVRGPYFVILTFGIAELVKYVLIAVEASLGNASRVILGAPEAQTLYFIMLGLAMLTTVIAYAVRRSRLSYGLRAIRENEEAAGTIGIPVTKYKLIALVLSAAIPGAVGGVMALRATYFEPRMAFDPMISFSMIAMAIIGGSDDLRGPILGAILLTVLQELLWANAPQAYMILLGILLVIFVRFAPEGIGGLMTRMGTRRA